MLSFGIGHGAAAVEAERGIAVMAENTITRGVSKIPEIPVMRVSRSSAIFFSVASDMIECEKFYRFRSTRFPVVIAGAGKPPVCHHHGKAKLSVVTLCGLKFFFSPFRVIAFLVPFISRITPATFNFFLGCSPLVIWIFTPNHCARMATKPSDFSMALESLFARWTNKFTNLHLTHGRNITQHEVFCQ